MTARILFAPNHPKPILDVALALKPPQFELMIHDNGTPEYYRAAEDADFYLGMTRNIDAKLFAAAKKMRLVQLLSAGYDRADLAAARKAGIPIANNGGANAIAVAEHTLLLMLATLKKLTGLHADVTAGQWRSGASAKAPVHELRGKTVGIVGLGNIGKKVARRAAAFDVTIQYYDIARLTEDEEDALGVRFVLFTELLRTSDIVTLHVPLDASTRNLIGAAELALMKPTAVLINTCRGPVVNETALHDALKNGAIAMAGLDVMSEEPPKPENPLFVLSNVILTPHAAGPTVENWTDRFRNGFDNIQRVHAGRKPKWVIPELVDIVR
ncbi:MAG: 2-hydroxyacid dehydrogenase [Burkholderiales bacterium]|nr:2-hydroxyacid dehydrogenase [Burkholderiales bacterium]